jgi:allantoate deiminase
MSLIGTNVDSCAYAREVVARCQRLASFSEQTSSLRRTFLSAPMHDCHREISNWLEPLGAEVRVDAAGNLRALYPASEINAPRLLVGSHLDSVPNAGAYDGVLGVVLAIALLQALKGRKLPFGIEVVGFSEEEGVRFGVPFIGSRALVGRLDEEVLLHEDVDGVSVQKAIEQFGLKVSDLPQATLQDDVAAYIEFHIEQGPVLEALGLPLGVVETIAGQSRLNLTFVGRAGHAGTTPMHLRADAVAAAAEWITAVEQLAHGVPGLVATVGKVEAKPGAANVIAGEARLTLDARHANDEVREPAVQELIQHAEAIAKRRGLTVAQHTRLNQPAVTMNPFLVEQIEQAMRRAGCQPHRMVSGAGHDAMILAERVPAAMIFLRTPGGISHHPAESVAVDDVAEAIECGLHLLDQLAAIPELQKRISRA